MKPIAVERPYGTNHFIPAGCLHWPIGEKDKIKEWVEDVGTKKNAFTMLMGDTQDAQRTHRRDFVRAYRADRNSQVGEDRLFRQDVKDLAKLLWPVRKRIIGAILGNHYYEDSNGINSEQHLCEALGVPYLGPMGVARLDFRDRGGKHRKSLVLYAHHNGGSKGGRTTGSDINTLERQETTFDADIYALSHTHRKLVSKIPKMTLTKHGSPVVRAKNVLFLRTGAFLKGYGEDNPKVDKAHFPSYVEEAAYRPTDLGHLVVQIDFAHRNDDYEVDYRVTQ